MGRRWISIGSTTQSSTPEVGTASLGSYVARYGGNALGTSDCTTALNAALSDLYSVSGGQLTVEPGSYLLLGQITIPNDHSATPTTPYSAAMPRQPSLLITGAGGSPSGSPVTTRFLMRWQNPNGDAGKGAAFAGAKLNSMGYGVLEISHILFDTDQADDSTPFLWWSNTIVDVHNCSFRGNNNVHSTWSNETQSALYIGKGGKMDAIAIGSWPGTGNVNLAYDGTLGSNFNGYGSRIRRCSFAGVRRSIVGGGNANNWLVEGINVNGGSNVDTPWGACIEISDGCNNISIRDSQIQSAGWNTGILVSSGPTWKSVANHLLNNGVWDPVSGNVVGTDSGPAGRIVATDAQSNALSATSLITDTYYPGGTYVTVDTNPITSFATDVKAGSISFTCASSPPASLATGSLIASLEYDGEGRPLHSVREWMTVSTVVGTTVTLAKATISDHFGGTLIMVVDTILQSPTSRGSATIVVNGTNASGALAVGAEISIVDIELGKRNLGSTETFAITSLAGPAGGLYTITLDRPTAMSHGWPGTTSLVLTHQRVKLPAEPVASLITTVTAQTYGVSNNNSGGGNQIVTLTSITKGDGTTVKVGDTICVQTVSSSAGATGTNKQTLPINVQSSNWATVQAIDAANKAVTLSRIKSNNHAPSFSCVLLGPFNYAVSTMPIVPTSGTQVRQSSISPPRYYPMASEVPHRYWAAGGSQDEQFDVLGIESRGANETTLVGSHAAGVSSLSVAEVRGILSGSHLRVADLTATSAPGGQGYGVAQENAKVGTLSNVSAIASVTSSSVFSVTGGQGTRFSNGQTIAIISFGKIQTGTILTVVGDVVTLTGPLSTTPIVGDGVTPTGAGTISVTEGLFYSYPSGAQVMPGPFILKTTPFIEQRTGAVATGQNSGVVLTHQSVQNVIDNGGVAPLSSVWDLASMPHAPRNLVLDPTRGPLTTSGYVTGRLGVAARAWPHRPSDNDFVQQSTPAPIDGLLGVDNVNPTLFVRMRGLWRAAANTVRSNISMSGDPNDPSNPSLIVLPGIGTQVASVFRGLAGQTADILQVQDSTGATNAKIRADGSITGTTIAGTTLSVSHGSQHGPNGSDKLYTWGGRNVSTFLEPYNRLLLSASNQSSVNISTGNSNIGAWMTVYFIPDFNFTASTIRVISGPTATSVLTTNFSLGIFSVASSDGSNDNLTANLGYYFSGVQVQTAGTAYVVNDALTQTSTSGTGTGFTATVDAVSTGAITNLHPTAGGINYAAGDTITLSNAHAGTNAIVKVVSTSSGAVTGVTSPLVTINTSYGGNITSDGNTATTVSFVRGTCYALGIVWNGTGTASIRALSAVSALFSIGAAVGRQSNSATYPNGVPTTGFTITAPGVSSVAPYIYMQ